MKKTTHLLCALLLISLTFLISPAKAQVPPCTDADPTTGGCPTGGGTSMPINNGVVYLLITGLIIGIVVIKKYKTDIHTA